MGDCPPGFYNRLKITCEACSDLSNIQAICLPIPPSMFTKTKFDFILTFFFIRILYFQKHPSNMFKRIRKLW